MDELSAVYIYFFGAIISAKYLLCTMGLRPTNWWLFFFSLLPHQDKAMREIASERELAREKGTRCNTV